MRRNEHLRSRLRRTYRFVSYHLAKALMSLRADPTGLLYVDPSRIVRTVSRHDDTWRGNDVWHFGTVKDGDWDRDGYLVRQHSNVHPILEQRVIGQCDYEDIPEYVQLAQEIENGEFVDGCTTSHELRERWRKIESLYWSIKENGYKTQAQLGSSNPLDEIRVQIGRDGELLLEEGRHRLAIAQILGLAEIPVLVTRRHLEWDRLRQDIIKIVLQRGFVHQPFDHPDLDILPRAYGNDLKNRAMYGHERWKFVVESLPIRSGTVLDIGAYFGYFVHRFEDLGFRCIAVEPDPENLAVLKRYRQMKGKTFEVIESSIFDVSTFEFDLVLALNIFHHLTKTRTDYEKLVQFLRKLRCQGLYFEPQEVGGGTYRSFTDDEFVDFVLTNSVLEKSQRLGRAREGRDVYLLTVE